MSILLPYCRELGGQSSLLIGKAETTEILFEVNRLPVPCRTCAIILQQKPAGTDLAGRHLRCGSLRQIRKGLSSSRHLASDEIWERHPGGAAGRPMPTSASQPAGTRSARAGHPRRPGGHITHTTYLEQATADAFCGWSMYDKKGDAITALRYLYRSLSVTSGKYA